MLTHTCNIHEAIQYSALEPHCPSGLVWLIAAGQDVEWGQSTGQREMFHSWDYLQDRGLEI